MNRVPSATLTPAGAYKRLLFVPALCLFWATLGCGSGGDPAQVAQSHLSAGEPDAAVEILQRAVENDPANPALQLQLGLALLANRQPGLAVWPLRRSTESPEHNQRGLFHLALALLQSKNGLEAARVAGELLAEHPNHWQALRLKVNAHISGREWEQERPLTEADLKKRRLTRKQPPPVAYRPPGAPSSPSAGVVLGPDPLPLSLGSCPSTSSSSAEGGGHTKILRV